MKSLVKHYAEVLFGAPFKVAKEENNVSWIGGTELVCLLSNEIFREIKWSWDTEPILRKQQSFSFEPVEGIPERSGCSSDWTNDNGNCCELYLVRRDFYTMQCRQRSVLRIEVFAKGIFQKSVLFSRMKHLSRDFEINKKVLLQIFC